MEKESSCTNELCANRDIQLRLARLREELLTNFNTLLLERIRFLEQTIHRLSFLHTSDFIDQPLRRSSSATCYHLIEAGARSCPSSVDLSDSNEKPKWFLSIKKPPRIQARTSSDTISDIHLSIPKPRPLSSSTNDLVSTSAISTCEKGRLESRRFACDVDDNEVRAFKAMVYMEQARKQHARPLTRLRQALGISSSNSNNSMGSFPSYIPKKHTNS